MVSGASLHSKIDNSSRIRWIRKKIIPDPDSGSRIQGEKALDPGYGSSTLLRRKVICICTYLA
jgi:hypothetical protein